MKYLSIPICSNLFICYFSNGKIISYPYIRKKKKRFSYEDDTKKDVIISASNSFNGIEEYESEPYHLNHPTCQTHVKYRQRFSIKRLISYKRNPTVQIQPPLPDADSQTVKAITHTVSLKKIINQKSEKKKKASLLCSCEEKYKR